MSSTANATLAPIFAAVWPAPSTCHLRLSSAKQGYFPRALILTLRSKKPSTSSLNFLTPCANLFFSKFVPSLKPKTLNQHPTLARTHLQPTARNYYLGKYPMAEDIINIRTRVAGTSRRQKWVWHLEKDTPVYLEREPENPYDPNAIAVYAEIPYHGDKQIGYVPREIAADIAPYIDEGYIPTARIIALFGGEPGKPTRSLALSITLKKTQPTTLPSKPTSLPPREPKNKPEPEPGPPPQPKNLPLAWLFFLITAGLAIFALLSSPLVAIFSTVVTALAVFFISPKTLTCPDDAYILFAGLAVLIAFISIPTYANGTSSNTVQVFNALIAVSIAFTTYTLGRSLACPKNDHGTNISIP